MSTVGYFIECFQERLKRDKNPLLPQQMQQNSNTTSISYYEIDKNSIIIHSTKNYKCFNKKTPEKILLEPGLKIGDKNEILKKKTNEILTSKTEILKKQENMQENLLKTELMAKNEPLKKPLIEELPEEKPIMDTPSYELLEKYPNYIIFPIFDKILKETIIMKSRFCFQRSRHSPKLT
jgi:hypothetical protein